MSKNNEDIFYNPKIEYDKNYETKGKISRQKDSNIEPTNDINDIIDLNNSINRYYSLINLLPEDLREVAKNPVNIIKEIIGEIPPDIKPIPKKEEEIIIKPQNIPNDIPDYPTDPFDDNNYVTIEVKNNNDKIVIQNQYYIDLVNIVKDYIDKLNESINKYIDAFFLSFKDIGIDNYLNIIAPYSVSSSKVKLNFKHLSDTIIRSQLSRQMKQRLYLKLYDIDKTINHIRNCKAAVELRLRYYDESYIDDNNFNDAVSNKILGQNRIIYDKKYKQNFINLYKYLNSSVILLDECINMNISEIQAKLILHEKGEKIW